MNTTGPVDPSLEGAPEPTIISRDDGATIAYHLTSGKHPGVIFLTGFKSDMTGGKAMAVEAFCHERGQAILRFDYTGHGQSSGEFEDGTIGQWAADAVYALDRLTEGPQVLVGSSMGGWIMLLTALARPERIAGLIGLAAAPDFTEDLPNCYDDQEPYRISGKLIEEGRNNLLLGAEISIDVPVRLIQGLKDEDIPWKTSARLSERLQSDNVEVTLVKSGDHRLSEPDDIDRLTRTLGGLLDQLETT